MKIKTIAIHNFRSIKDIFFNVNNYSILLGANNTGKTNIMTAIRIFYEDNIKFNESIDFPKFKTTDEESWVELSYLLDKNEYNNIRNEYKNQNKILKVRKYLKSENRVKTNQSNIFAYENGKLSDNLFYGAKNISQAKLGRIIYIPEIAKTSDTLKLSGPSPLRKILNFVINKVIKDSQNFKKLNKEFDDFNKNFKKEASMDGFSLKKLFIDINDNLKEWGIEFNMDINPINPEIIIKNLISPFTIDKNLNKKIDVKSLGQGLQRHLIFTLLKLLESYSEKRLSRKKDFSPEFTFLLFEEPEAFLHPHQQKILNDNLHSFASNDQQQVLVSTHSPFFISKHIEELSNLVRLTKENSITKIFQISETELKEIIKENNELIEYLSGKLDDPAIDNSIKNTIRHIIGDTQNEIQIEEESIRYLLWLNSERCCVFFSDIVLICEGASEKIFIDYLINNQWYDLKKYNIYVLDSMGKFNIHRYMNLFKGLGIKHSVLYDKDTNSKTHQYINQFINDQKNIYTMKIDFFNQDLEAFLQISPPPPNRRDKKPLNILWHYKNGKINNEQIIKLKEKIETLINIKKSSKVDRKKHQASIKKTPTTINSFFHKNK